MRKYTTPERRESVTLEPRVAKLEVGLDRLTSDVRDLAQVVREQGGQMEQQIQQLIVAVTQASGPKKTDWSTIFAGLAVVLAIGSAAFWPLNQTAQENKQMTHVLEQKYDDHARLDNHPVGEALIQRLEDNLKTHMIAEDKNHTLLATQVREESIESQECLDGKLTAMQEKNQLYIDKLYARVVRLEEQNLIEAERDKDELSMWRQKSMGLTAPPIGTHSHLDLTNPDSPSK